MQQIANLWANRLFWTKRDDQELVEPGFTGQGSLWAEDLGF